eukprot:gb/GECG01000652.1/.p1 GENE.gb/GECG01000652.1/~~gb/GECG01000652.1/.p1  ORF type:complete len:156 (+),score=12.40 gb/GECG01000652.1/:1-468(+)
MPPFLSKFHCSAFLRKLLPVAPLSAEAAKRPPLVMALVAVELLRNGATRERLATLAAAAAELRAPTNRVDNMLIRSDTTSASVLRNTVIFTQWPRKSLTGNSISDKGNKLENFFWKDLFLLGNDNENSFWIFLPLLPPNVPFCRFVFNLNNPRSQ